MRHKALPGGLVVLLTVLLGVAQPGLAAPAAGAQAEGTIAAVEPGGLTITNRAGAQVRVVTTSETTIIQRRQVTLEAIRPNDFVGVTARRSLGRRRRRRSGVDGVGGQCHLADAHHQRIEVQVVVDRLCTRVHVVLLGTHAATPASSSNRPTT